mgnify:CR=1 FL=1|tara:strand:+ start:618 stop:815 length:198 start_codon:yes stop_codon:yes gene_type:complete
MNLNKWSVGVAEGKAFLEMHNGLGGNKMVLALNNDDWRDLMSILESAMRCVDTGIPTIDIEEKEV